MRWPRCGRHSGVRSRATSWSVASMTRSRSIAKRCRRREHPGAEPRSPRTDAAGVTPNIVHVTSEAIAAADPDMGAGHLGDRSHSMIFDNSLVKSLVPAFNPTIGFAEGAREIIGWYDAHPEQQVVDPALDALFDRLATGA